MTIRTYDELQHLKTFEERFDYLSLNGYVGESTFGFDRYLNQQFYRSVEWKNIRKDVIVRDAGCDLGVEGYEIFGQLLIHHINPIRPEDITSRVLSILDPAYLITTTHKTHLAIHYGDKSLLASAPAERAPGDTKLW